MLAAAQVASHGGDLSHNVAEHARAIVAAARRGASLVVFPELSLTGYELDLAAGLAFSPSDPRLAPLLEVAAAHSMTLVAGAPVRIGPRLHIAAFVIGPDGAVGLYTKHRLGAFPPAASCDGAVPPAEATVFAPGTLDPLVRFGGNTAAVAICADIGDPSHPRRAVERGADTYLAGMFVIPSEFEREAVSLGAYAARHSLTVVFANFGGPSGGLRSAGRSGIWSGTGELLARLDPVGTGLAVALESDAGWHAKAIMLGGP
jgi:predicted amidohydrolase